MARKVQVEILGDSSSLERSFRRASSAAGGFNRDINRAGRGVIAVSAGYRSLARSVAFASGAFVGAAGITAGLKASITGFSQFNDAMQRSVGLAGVAQKSVAGFSKQILELAPKVGKSPQELANAFYFVASSGIAASKAMDVVTAAAKASAAGLGETQVIADAVTSAMNAYGPSVLSAQKATDVLVATVREGKGEADQFAGVIGNVTALASQLGVSFNDVGAALAAMTRLGTNAETSATQLQRVFTSLVKVTPQQAKAFKSVGLNADVLRQQLGTKGLLFVLNEVRKAFGNNIPAIEKAFGDIRAFRGVIALVGKQAGATQKIFKDLSNTTGSLKTAFDAVSNDTAQQFRRLRASAEVAGISIGAVFAPLAGKIADVLASAANDLTKFFDRIGQAKTFDAKVKVVFSGIEGAASAIESSLGTAISGVDWTAVWARARGIADGLQKSLERVDFGSFGETIGKAISSSARVALPAAKDIAQRITKAVGAIDVVAFGRKLGPGLAAALVEAFATLTDPAFWIRNWDLALAVGLTAFGGAVGKIAGKFGALLARPLARAGEDGVLALAGAVERFAPRVAEALLSTFLRLPRLIDQVLAPLTSRVERAFGRLGRVARFTVKVLGIDLAIHAVGQMLANLGRLIGHGLDGVWDAMKTKAINAALAIIEPFTHLPGFLGGGPFRAMKDALQNQLDGMAAAAHTTASAIQNALAGVTFAGSSAAETAASPNRSRGFVRPSAAPPAVKHAARTAAVQQATKVATDAASATVAKGFTLPFRLQLEQAKADASASAADDLKAARDVRAFILKAIPHLNGQKLIDAYQQLGQVNQALATAAEKAKGFAIPAALQLAQAKAAALGKPVTAILEKIRAAAQKAIASGRLGFQGQLDAWNAISSANDQLKSQANAALGKFRQANTKLLASGLGLTADQIKALRGRLSQVGPSGRVPNQGVGAFGIVVPDTVIHTHVHIAEREVGRSVTRFQQKRARRNPSQRRGPNAGLAS